MDCEEFRVRGKEMIDYIVDYHSNIKSRRVLPDVQPGYLRDLLPDSAPEEGESWNNVFQDIEDKIMPGVTHWNSPHFHAYFPAANSYPAMCADMLANAISCMGFTWIASPVCTELEVVVMDWLGKMLNLPSEFLACSNSNGGGTIQGTACESTLVALLSARTKMLNSLKDLHPDTEEGVLLSRLVAYTSDQAHCSVEKASVLAAIKLRLIESDEDYSMTAKALEEAISHDKEQGLVPFFVVATLGTTSCCAFDQLKEIGPICKNEDIWLHIDAAYAGASFICPEFRPLLNGVQHAESFNFNAHKWLLVNFDCSCLWFKNVSYVVNAFNIDPVYLKSDKQGPVPDYRHWQIALSRKFRALKLWFVLRMYGVNGLQDYIKKHVNLAKYFENLVLSDGRFDVVAPVHLGLVCFRLKGSNSLNEDLLRKINDGGKIHLMPTKLREMFILRFAICAANTTSDDIKFSWKIIQDITSDILNEDKQNSCEFLFRNGYLIQSPEFIDEQ